MSTTRLSRIFFCVALFFTTVCFVDNWRMPFFLNSNYKILKFILAFVLPYAATVINYYFEKSFVFIGKATAIIQSLFVVGYIIDALFVHWIAEFGNFMIIYHLSYALISVFSVLLAAVIIQFFTKNTKSNFATFYKDFFLGYTVMFAMIFVLMYFIIRDFGGTQITYIVNFKLFNGEIHEMLNQFTISVFIRFVGNILFYTSLSLLVISLTKKDGLGLVIPIAVSFCAEAFQYFFNCGDCDIDDIFTNTLGAIIGFLAYKFIIKKLLNKTEDKKCLE